MPLIPHSSQRPGTGGCTCGAELYDGLCFAGAGEPAALDGL